MMKLTNLILVLMFLTSCSYVSKLSRGISSIETTLEIAPRYSGIPLALPVEEEAQIDLANELCFKIGGDSGEFVQVEEVDFGVRAPDHVYEIDNNFEIKKSSVDRYISTKNLVCEFMNSYTCNKDYPSFTLFDLLETDLKCRADL